MGLARRIVCDVQGHIGLLLTAIHTCSEYAVRMMELRGSSARTNPGVGVSQGSSLACSSDHPAREPNGSVFSFRTPCFQVVAARGLVIKVVDDEAPARQAIVARHDQKSAMSSAMTATKPALQAYTRTMGLLSGASIEDS